MSIQPDLLSCPFCGSQPMILGMDRAQHPVAGCILSGRTIAAREFREWNKRTQLPDAGQLCNSTVEMADDDVSIRCNKCGWHGNEEDLAATIDAIDKEPSRACPTCKTDNYLMDIDLDAGLIGTISTPRHRAVRYQIGNEAGDVFGRDSGYDGPTLTVEIADMIDGLAMLRALAKGGA